MLTSNKGFEEWGEAFGDEVMAGALIDRLVHHCHLVTIRGSSYRMRQHTEIWQTLHAVADDAPAPPVRRWRRSEARSLIDLSDFHRQWTASLGQGSLTSDAKCSAALALHRSAYDSACENTSMIVASLSSVLLTLVMPDASCLAAWRRSETFHPCESW